MVTAEILNSHTVKTLRSEISKQNIKGYSKTGVKKPELIALMLKNKERFMHIKMNVKPVKKAKAKAPAKEKAPAKAKAPKATHKMPDGSKMTGKVHSKDSVPVDNSASILKKAIKEMLPKKTKVTEDQIDKAVNKFLKKN